MTLQFTLPDGTAASVTVKHLLDGGYAGRNQESVQAHIDELAALGVPGPKGHPDDVPGRALPGAADPHRAGAAQQHLRGGRMGPDHRRRRPPAAHPAPNLLGSHAWVLSEISDHLDQITLRSWVTNGGVEEEIQTGSLADLLPPGLWVEVLKERRNFARDDRAVGDLEHARGCEPVRRSLARRNERSGHRQHHQHRLRRRADGQADQLTAR